MKTQVSRIWRDLRFNRRFWLASLLVLTIWLPPPAVSQSRNAASTGLEPMQGVERLAPRTTVRRRNQQRFGWFWARVHPGLAGQGRFEAAMSALRTAPPSARVPEPSVQALSTIALTHGVSIVISTVGTQVSPALVLAVIIVESSGRPLAISPAGARGLMQLMPATAARFGVEDPLDPQQNIRGGVTYLDWLLDEFNQDVVLALAGYNAGEGAVRRNRGVPPYAETRDYVPRVLAAWSVARTLCSVVPVVPTDGCIFALRSP